MKEINYEQLQNEIKYPQRLCKHCGECKTLDGNKATTTNKTGIWTELPENCGFSGLLFFEREKQKHLVRKIKEEIYALSFLPQNAVVAKDTLACERIKELEEQISPWYKHGAQNW